MVDKYTCTTLLISIFSCYSELLEEKMKINVKY